MVFARFYREWSAGDIARRFHISEESVYVRLSRAYRKLGKTLAGYAGPEWGRRGGASPGGGDCRCLDSAAYARLVEAMAGPGRRPLPARVAACPVCMDRLLAGELLWRVLRSALGPGPSSPNPALSFGTL